MSLSTNTTYRVLVEKLGAADTGEFVGNEGELFYDPSTPAIYLSDGSTAGGLEIAGGGGSGESYWVANQAGIHTTSNVGIGTTNPQTRLQINGVLGFGTFIRFSQTRTNIRIGDTTTGANLTSGFDNIFMGIGAGNSTTTGYSNNFFGYNAGSNSTGNHNNFFGRYAGQGKKGIITGFTVDSSTTLIGEANNSYSGVSASGGNGNSATFDVTRDANGDVLNVNIINNGINYQVDDTLTIDGASVGGSSGTDDITLTIFDVGSNGNHNNFFGEDAGRCNTFGNRNNFFGECAGYYNTSGCRNNFFGECAGYRNITGCQNNFLGIEAGKCNTTGSNNNFFGSRVGYSNTTGCHNNFFGNYAGYYNTTGRNNNFFGRDAGCSNTEGNYNNFFGEKTGLYNTTGSQNNFFGECAGYYNTTGGFNNFFGSAAGLYNTTGCDNNFFGRETGYYNTTGCYNNFFGSFAGRNNITGSNNNFLGGAAGYYNTTGCSNNFFGCAAGSYNTTGSNNNFLGAYAGSSNTTGCSNNFFNSYAGNANSTGSFNNFIGRDAGRWNTEGNNNTFIGNYAGYCNTIGNFNTFLGAYTSISTSASNKIILGRGNGVSQLFDVPDTTKDTQFAVGIRTDSNPANYWLVGNENFNVGIGTTNPTSKLTVQSGDIRVGINTSQGVILTDANGVAWRLIVNTDGTLTTVAV